MVVQELLRGESEREKPYYLLEIQKFFLKNKNKTKIN